MLFNNDGCVVLALIYQTEHIAYVFARNIIFPFSFDVRDEKNGIKSR